MHKHYYSVGTKPPPDKSNTTSAHYTCFVVFIVLGNGRSKYIRIHVFVVNYFLLQCFSGVTTVAVVDMEPHADCRSIPGYCKASIVKPCLQANLTKDL